ncbi:MAG: Hsp20/alpha crystallin family protein [Armatimonadota bacterium]|jgi:HSP20 family protein
MRRELTDPIEDFFELRDRLYHLLDESFAAGQAQSAPSFSPPVDILAGDAEVVILVELPGMSREDVSVEIENGTVTISGERPNGGEGRYFVRERPIGDFSRSFSLAWELDAESVSAKLDAGVLRVTVGRRERERTIEVSDESGA